MELRNNYGGVCCLLFFVETVASVVVAWQHFSRSLATGMCPVVVCPHCLLVVACSFPTIDCGGWNNVERQSNMVSTGIWLQTHVVQHKMRTLIVNFEWWRFRITTYLANNPR